jgi:exodeoxyribonuclease V beta subunit
MADTPEKTPAPITELDGANCPLVGVNLIEAAAGTGKTFAITRLYLRLLLEGKLLPSQILVVTFTEAATRELRERIRLTLEAALRSAAGGGEPEDPFFHSLFGRLDRSHARVRLAEALHSFDSAAIHTIHGFCRQVLSEHAFESGTRAAEQIITDEKELRELVAADFWRRHFYRAAPSFLAFAAAEKCTGPGWFVELFRVRKGVEAYRLLPPCDTPPDTAGPEAALAALMARAAPLWKEGKTEITNLLASPSLKQNVYSPKINERLCARVDELMERGFLDREGLADFKKIGAPSLLAATKKGAPPPSHPFFDACEEIRSSLAALHDAYRAKILALKIEFLSRVDADLGKEKTRQGLLGFDDLLLRVAGALARGKDENALRNALRDSYKAALIDEFQDTDPVQYAIFDSIFGRAMPLFYIGDPKQAIYRFRGADIYAYFEASRNASTRYTLSTNYRSDPLLIEAVNRLFAGHGNPFAFRPVEYRQVKAGLDGGETALTMAGERRPPFVLWLFKRDSADSVEPLARGASGELVMNAVTGEISRLLSGARLGTGENGRAVKPADIAVLVRTNREAAAMREALEEAQIPAVLYLSGSVLGSFEAVEFEILLSALAEPHRHEYLRAALATSFFGLSGGEIDRLADDDRLWSSYQARLQRSHDAWRTEGILPMVRRLMNEEQVRRRLLVQRSGERRLTNLLHLAELLHARSVRSGAGMAAMVTWLSDGIMQCGESVPPDEEMLRLESDEEAVRIVTIHKSKGLEYPIVFCPDTWNASSLPADKEFKLPFVFHDPGHDYEASIALGGDAIRQFRPLAEEESLAENIRLLYVAITRAKSRCYCAWGPVKGAETSALAWVLFGRLIENDPVARLRASVAGLSDRNLDAALDRLRKGAASSIEIVPLPVPIPRPPGSCPDGGPIPNRPVPRSLTARSFEGVIAPPRRILSFSGLAHSLPLSDREWIDDGFFPKAPPPQERGTRTIADFPRGAEAGTFLHAVLATADFANPSSPETAAALLAGLARGGFAAALQESVAAMLRTVAGATLDPISGLRLGRVPFRRTVREMEFYFPVQPFLRGDIFELAGEESRSGNIPAALPELKTSGGHLKGYIDLVFEWNDRFYIIDWKSNYLGDDDGAYSPAALAGVMVREHYRLQYHLYTVALHRYLRLRRPDYSYEKHFGGAYYLFLRGLGGVEGDGIFFDRPDAARIRRMDTLLTGTGHASIPG